MAGFSRYRCCNKPYKVAFYVCHYVQTHFLGVFPSEPMFDPETIKEFARSLVACVIWVPYMLISKRVKATFVEHMPNKQMQPTAETID